MHDELKLQTYKPKPLQTFILQDPKTRKISKLDFRDRIVHHALIRVIESIFDKTLIYDNCANRKGKGNLFAIKRFDKFKRKVTNNLKSEAFCLKADIKHYFKKVDRTILLNIIKRKIKCEKTIHLIELILNNFDGKKGMPLGNLTSQFFANVYLNELDQFVKHILKAKYYIRYVDDFVLMNSSKEELVSGGASDFAEDKTLQLINVNNRARSRGAIKIFLNEKLKLRLHPDKSRIINLSQGIDFVGFRNFYHFRLLRKRNIKNMQRKIDLFNKKEISYEKFLESFNGWNAYAKWADSFKLMEKLIDCLDGNLNKCIFLLEKCKFYYLLWTTSYPR